MTSPSQIKMDTKSDPPQTSSIQFVPQHSHFSQNFPHFAQPLHLVSPQQSQFSPINFNEPPLGPRIIRERSSTSDQPAEILDLDSNRVHLYAMQQQDQNFYRPYLMGQHVGNGWPPQHMTPEAHYSSSANHYQPHDLYIRNTGSTTLVTTTAHQAFNNYENSYGHSPVPDLLPPACQPNHSPVLNQQQRDAVSPPLQPTTKTSASKKAKCKEVTIPDMMRGKGKGGACKRPKAYECTTCSKWFTSSGHLKRHYGTTLHKNAVHQNGTEGLEPPVGPGRGRGRKSKKLIEEMSNEEILGLPSLSPRPGSTGSNGMPTNGFGQDGVTKLTLQPVQYPPTSAIMQSHQTYSHLWNTPAAGLLLIQSTNN